jgi:hypothetical protein
MVELIKQQRVLEKKAGYATTASAAPLSTN